MFETNMTGVDEGGNFPLLPIGVYSVKVLITEETESAAGDPMVKATFEVIDGEFVGRFAFDRLLFPLSGSKAEKIKGRSMHFLHIIGEPYEGKFKVDPDNWIGKKCSIFIMHKEVTEGDFKGNTYANIRGYDPIDPEVKDQSADNSIPF